MGNINHDVLPTFNPNCDTTDKFVNVVAAVREEYLSTAQNYPWVVGFSGGKDSTLVVHAVFDALLSVAPLRRTRPVHIVSNDTLVESPPVMSHVRLHRSNGLTVFMASQSPDDYAGQTDDYMEQIGLPICFKTNATSTAVLNNMFKSKPNFASLESGTCLTVIENGTRKVRAF